MSYYTSLFLNTFKKDSHVKRYGVEDSITPRGRKILQLVDLFDIELKATVDEKDDPVSRRNALLAGVDEHEIAVEAAKASSIFAIMQGIDSTPQHLLRSSQRQGKSGTRHMVFCSSDSSLKPKNNDDLFFSSSAHLTFMLGRLKSKYDTEIFSFRGKLGKLELYDDFFIASFYKNVSSYDITFFEEQPKETVYNPKEGIKVTNNSDLTYTLKVIRPDTPINQKPIIDFTDIRKSVLQMVEHELPNKKDVEQYLYDLEKALEDVKEIAEYYSKLENDEKDVFKFGLPEKRAEDSESKVDPSTLPSWARRASRVAGGYV